MNDDVGCERLIEPARMQALICDEGETLYLGDGTLSVSISRLNGSYVRLGIEAPREVAIHREEIYSLIKGGSHFGLAANAARQR